jgi:hypothetical protein
MIRPFYFFQTNLYLWLYSTGKNPFQIMIKLFFFFLFQTNLFLRPYSTGKNQFQIMISPLFFFFFFSFSFSFSNKLVFCGLIPLGGLSQPPNLSSGWAGSGDCFQEGQTTPHRWSFSKRIGLGLVLIESGYVRIQTYFPIFCNQTW